MDTGETYEDTEMRVVYRHLSDGAKLSSLTDTGEEEQRFGMSSSEILDFGAKYYDPWTCQWMGDRHWKCCQKIFLI